MVLADLSLLQFILLRLFVRFPAHNAGVQRELLQWPVILWDLTPNEMTNKWDSKCEEMMD